MEFSSKLLCKSGQKLYLSEVARVEFVSETFSQTEFIKVRLNNYMRKSRTCVKFYSKYSLNDTDERDVTMKNNQPYNNPVQLQFSTSGTGPDTVVATF